MATIKLVPKAFTKEYLKQNASTVFQDRELIVEVEKGSTKENTVLRFKIGDGVKPYSQLPYVSSLYALFPSVNLCDNNYQNILKISLEDCDDSCSK